MSLGFGPLEAALAFVAAAGAAFWLHAGTRLLALSRSRHFPRLPDLPVDEPEGGWPRLSVIVPARNEAATVEAAMRALLLLDYPSLEVVAVNDRSTDETGRFLDALAATDPRLRVRHLKALPEGWLGKNHAMARGADETTGEWLLFTDADVHFAPDTLKRALPFALHHGLGHLVAFPHLVAPGFLERAFVSAFAVFASLGFRVWDLPRAGTRAFTGVGAFNLVRRSDYERVGGHARLALEVIDDVKLGLVLRRRGTPQGACDSGGLVKVRWQDGFVASLGGLMKNACAGAEWQIGLVLLGALGFAFFSTGPLAALLLCGSGGVRALGLLGLLAPALIHGALARRAGGGNGLEGLLFPLCGLLLSSVLLWSAVLATWRQGIVWRGTFYPLDVLRKGCVYRRDFPAAGAPGWPRG